MIDLGIYKSLEKRLGPVVGLAGAAAVVLHVLGYLSLRFWLRALGLAPELDLVSERYLFEGAAQVIFLLTMVPVLLAALLLGAGFWWLARRPAPLRRGLDRLVSAVRSAPPRWLAVGGGVWAIVTVQFFLRHVLQYRDLAHRGMPCDPAWLPPVARSDGPLEALFFSLLLLLPLPTLWVVSRLSSRPSWRPAMLLLVLVAWLQVVLVPVHYGVLVAGATVPRVLLPDADPGVRAWQVYRSREHVHLLVVEPGPPPTRRLRAIPVKAWGAVDIESMDAFYEILMEGRTCGR